PPAACAAPRSTRSAGPRCAGSSGPWCRSTRAWSERRSSTCGRRPRTRSPSWPRCRRSSAGTSSSSCAGWPSSGRRRPPRWPTSPADRRGRGRGGDRRARPTPGRLLWWLVARQRGRVAAASLHASLGMPTLALGPYLLGRAVDHGIADGDGPALAAWTGALLAAGGATALLDPATARRTERALAAALAGRTVVAIA